jgi:hypothetical protein
MLRNARAHAQANQRPPPLDPEERRRQRVATLDRMILRYEREEAIHEPPYKQFYQSLVRERVRLMTAEEREQHRQAIQNKKRVDWFKKTEKPARVVKISELCQPCEEGCMICLENHPKHEMVVLGCNHELGRTCLFKMAELHPLTAKLCPLCRDPIKAFRGFRRRAAPRPREPAPK